VTLETSNGKYAGVKASRLRSGKPKGVETQSMRFVREHFAHCEGERNHCKGEKTIIHQRFRAFTMLLSLVGDCMVARDERYWARDC